MSDNREGDMLSSVWQEACRHIEIASSCEAIARAIAGHIPVAMIVVLRVDVRERTLETLAVGTAPTTVGRTASNALTPLPRTPVFPAGVWKKLTSWLLRGGVVGGGSDELRAVLEAVFSDSCAADAVAGPLRSADVPRGILLLVAATDRAFSDADRRSVGGMLEPFVVAVENDDRLHELNALREAAEADRRSLLTRLGRQDADEHVVGAGTGLRHVMERVELVAGSDVPVLILGETGTGKEVVSRALHNRSKRSEGPFIRVNCGAIPAELIDSQLFGHEKGSFTGANVQHQGWFERADRGTLFLDEIGELPLAAQVRLLRVLQDHQIERVGGRSPVHVDVRIVAATHRDLAAMVKERTFREDLWYRINVFPILLPPLRDRPEDIPALVRHFVQRASARFGLSVVEPAESDLRLLCDYGWPGNIRELGAVIDRAAILGGGRKLDVAVALGLGRQAVVPAPANAVTMYEVIPETVAVGEPSIATGTDAIVPLATAMRQHIEKALVATRGRIEGRRGAAVLLQINPHTLRARMRKLGIDPDRFREKD